MIFFAGVLCCIFFLRLWLAAFGGLHPDEAYYWFWSQKLHLGYFDHPPLIAWIIRISREVVSLFVPHKMAEASPSFFALLEFRFLPYFISSVVTPLILGKCVELIQKKELNLSQMLVLISAPIFFFGPQVVTPDSVFFAAWALCLYTSLKFQQLRGADSFPGDPTPLAPQLAILAGFALALAAYAKFSAILAAFLVVIAGAGFMNSLIISGVALILVLPLLIWNFTVGRNEGGGIFFQLQNGGGQLWAASNYKRVGDLWITQVLFWNPLVFLSCLGIFFADFKKFFVAQKRSAFSGTLLLWTFVPLFFFSLSGLKRPAEGNWPLVGIIGALTLILSRYRKKVFTLAILILSNMATAVLGILILTKNQNLADRLESFSPRLATELRKPSRLHEFQEWQLFHTLIFEATRAESTYPIEVYTYQTLSELIFYDSISPPDEKLGARLKIQNEVSRRSQFHILPEYNLPTPKGPHWLVAKSLLEVPRDCKLSQSVYKGIADTTPFSIYRCQF